MGDWVRVIRSEDLVAGTHEAPGIRRVTAGRVDVLLARLGSGEVIAFDTVCPHQLTSLEDAYFFDGHLRCPRHQYLYDFRSGENVIPARDARPENLWKLKPGYLATYRVQEREGWIWVDGSPRPPPATYDPERERRPAGAPPSEGRPSAEQPVPPDAPGTVEHPAKTLKVNAGQSFELRLPTDPRPAFTWNVTVSAGLSVVEEGYLPGDRPRHRVRIRARRPGDGSVRCAYARPWDTVPAEVRSYVVRVVVPS